MAVFLVRVCRGETVLEDNGSFRDFRTKNRISYKKDHSRTSQGSHRLRVALHAVCSPSSWLWFTTTTAPGSSSRDETHLRW